jgi:hypothetical protein
LGVSKSTVGRVLARAGLSQLRDLEPSQPVVRHEHAHPGDLVHIDTKKLGRIERIGHRITGNRRDSVDGAGWELLFVAIDDHARIQLHSSLPTANQRQGRTFHPVGIARVGPRNRLSPLNGARRHTRALDTSLQLAPPTPGHQRGLAPVSRLAQSRNNLLTLHA